MLRSRLAAWLLFTGIGVLAPLLFTSAYHRHLEVLVLIYLMLILGMHLLSGVAGQVSFGQAAFMGIGAYAGGLTLVHTHLPYVVGALASIVIAAVAAVIVGPALMRLLGDYFIIATIALVEVVYLVLTNSVGLTGGPLGLSGIPVPTLGSLTVRSDIDFYYLTLVLDSIVFAGLLNLARSRIGRALVGIRHDELVMRSFGVRVQYYKVAVLTASAGLAGLAGLLFGSYAAYLNPTSFNYNTSVAFTIMIIIGGLGSLPGAVVGTILITLSPELLRPLGQWRLVLYGGVLAGLMVLRPEGLLGQRLDSGQTPLRSAIIQLFKGVVGGVRRPRALAVPTPPGADAQGGST